MLHVTDFISDMAIAYSAADLVISRAGAGSISEFCLLQKPVILVPSPNVAEDHKTKNALALTGRGAALLIADTQAATDLYNEALRLLADEPRQQQLQKRVLELAKPHATVLIVDELMRLIGV